MYKVTLIQGKNDMVFTFMSLGNALAFVEVAIDHSEELETLQDGIGIVAEVEKYDEPF